MEKYISTITVKPYFIKNHELPYQSITTNFWFLLSNLRISDLIHFVQWVKNLEKECCKSVILEKFNQKIYFSEGHYGYAHPYAHWGYGLPLLAKPAEEAAAVDARKKREAEAEADPEAWYYGHYGYGHLGYGYGGYYGYPYYGYGYYG